MLLSPYLWDVLVDKKVLDLGAGSGLVSMALARSPSSLVISAEFSLTALTNIEKSYLLNQGEGDFLALQYGEREVVDCWLMFSCF